MKIFAFFSLSVFVGVLSSGCRTNLFVDFRNETRLGIRIASGKTGEVTEIKPDHSKRLLHSTGDLLVVTERGESVRFLQVGPLEVEPRYRDTKSSAVVPYIVLRVVLDTNLNLHVLAPQQKAIDSADQPGGYPKIGQRLLSTPQPQTPTTPTTSDKEKP